MTTAKVVISFFLAVATTIAGEIIINIDKINKLKTLNDYCKMYNVPSLWETPQEYIQKLIFSWYTLIAIIALTLVFCFIFYAISKATKNKDQNTNNPDQND